MIIDFFRRQIELEYNQLSYWYFFSFALGIIYGFADLNLEIFPFLLIIAILPLALLLLNLQLSTRFIAICLLSFCCAIPVVKYRVIYNNVQPIEKPIVLKIQGKITKIKPTQHSNQVTIGDIQSKLPMLNKVRLHISRKKTENLAVGSQIDVKAKLFPPNHNLLPESFDFGFFLRMQQIQATGYLLNDLKIIGDTDINNESIINQIRAYIYQRLQQILGEDTGNFAAAIIIGETKAIPEKILANMRNTGTSHILSVSGLHLSLVALTIFVASRAILNISNYLAYNFNIKIIAAVISIIGSFIYLQISGNNIAAIRAFVMTVIFMISIIIDRSPHPLRSVLLAALLILLFMPEYILHPSFQLSFIAVFCLISGYELYTNCEIAIFDKKSWIGYFGAYFFANIYTSFLASIFTAPFVIFHFYQFANYSIIMNLIAVPLMSFIIMPLAILALILMPFNLDAPILQLAGVFIDLIIESADYVGNLPFAILNWGHITSMSLLIFTTGFCWICLLQTYWRYLGISIMLISLLMMVFTKTPSVIIDPARDIIGIKTSNEEIRLYAPYKLSKFITSYWKSWYGVDNIQAEIKNIYHVNERFILQNGESFSLNHSTCLPADIMLITSEKLRCPEIGTANLFYLKDLSELTAI